tara:strand:- start:1252 stop:2118 length:867 start_codon:yes stop_codon:yes gene_type:complete
MDLYGPSTQAISMGNSRRAEVRDLNERVTAHNNNVANTISGLKDKAKSAGQLSEIEASAKGLWTAKGMPDRVKSFNSWNDSRTASNVNAQAESAQRELASKQPVEMDALTDAQRTGVDSAPAGSSRALSEAQSVSETAEGVIGGKGTQLLKGTEQALEGGGSRLKAVGGALGEAAGVLGSAAIGGDDIYEDYKKSMAAGKLEIAGNNNWEKAGNILQIGGSIADVAGAFFPPAKLLGGILDLASSATGEVGQAEDNTASKKLDAQQTSQTETAPVISQEATISTGRVS